MNWNVIVSKEKLCGEFESVEAIIAQYGEAVVIQDNVPKYILKPFVPPPEGSGPERRQPDGVRRPLTAEEKNLLRRKLDSTGKGIFVTYYDHFRNQEDPLVFMAGEDFTETSKRARSSTARFIFRQGWECHALRYIIQKNRAAPEIVQQAREILSREEAAGTP